PFKIPRRVVFLPEIPKGPTGKVQRLGMAARLGLHAIDAPSYVTPHTTLEYQLAELWAQVLGVERVGMADNFFDLGGNSLLATQTFAQIATIFGQRLPLSVLIEDGTVAYLARLLAAERPPEERSSMVAIQPLGSRPPLFCVQPPIGTLLTYRF